MNLLVILTSKYFLLMALLSMIIEDPALTQFVIHLGKPPSTTDGLLFR